ncbi:hypothetical protein AVEN_239362-1 [Araneus ventricosus]|uniref:Uncharacterized protein n=1 Tax=Araneus ventricosus TaxID=182803 RepID=A0A4Y2EB03_ARAVE|nr:hypothetical protein AVEN_239362-1 [Araneus ventricosus]
MTKGEHSHPPKYICAEFCSSRCNGVPCRAPTHTHSPLLLVEMKLKSSRSPEINSEEISSQSIFGNRTPPHFPVPHAITATEPVEWTGHGTVNMGTSNSSKMNLILTDSIQV